MTSRKKEILSFFEPEHREWVTGEIGALPFDVSGVTYLLSGMNSFKSRHHLESARRTLEAMVNDGLLEKITSYEQRHGRTVHSQRQAKAYGVTAPLWPSRFMFGYAGR